MVRSLVALLLCTACGSLADLDGDGIGTDSAGIDRASARTKVAHAYRGVLGREPDEGGWSYYADLLAGGAGTAAFTGILFGSPEFAAERSALSAEALADELYRGILEREADAGGLTYTADEIRAGRAAARAAGMLDSPEFSQRFLDSPPPSGGTSDGAQLLASSLPASLRCGVRFYGSVTLQNTGTSSWSYPEFKLGIPPAQWEQGLRFASGDPARVWLPEGASVPPGASATFAFDYRAPASAGSVAFAVQMVHEGVRWFGAPAASEVGIECGVPTPSGPLQPLERSGNRFVAGGQPVRLLGGVVCCDDYPANGWPLVSNAYIDRMAAAGLNWTHVRTGPFIAGSEQPEALAHVTDPVSGAQDLSQYRSPYFERLRALIAYAGERGIYVEVDLVDAWPFKHGISAFSAGRNIQGLDGSCDWFQASPNAAVQTWVRKVVAETGSFANVMYEIGNESFGCNASDEWEMGIYATVKDELARRGFGDRLVGSNAYSDYLPVDYLVSHYNHLPVSGALPVVVNEFALEDPATDPMELALMSAMRLDAGVYFMAWRGSLGNDAFAHYLNLLGQVRTGALTEPPPDYACARIDRIGLKIHNNPAPGQYVLDATSKDAYNRPLGPEGSFRRLRCEADQVDTETEWGPRWDILGGQGSFAYNRNPYLFKVWPQTTMTVRVCSRRYPDACGILEVAP